MQALHSIHSLIEGPKLSRQIVLYAMPASKTQIALGGLWLQIFGLEELLARRDSRADKEAVVLFFLHGRFGSADRIEHVIQAMIDLTNAPSSPRTQSNGNGNAEGEKAKRSLLVVSFDQRNHGTRKISATGQQSWSEGNLKHAQDMLAMQAGTAADASFIADFLPSFLFPNGEAKITRWAVTGISLGGHACWMVLKNDPRFRIGVPMLGCPSYRTLMRQRAASNNLPFEPPYMPATLLDLLSRIDPDSVDFASSDGTNNPFYGKKIAVLHGDKDELVPWESSKDFVDALEVGPDGEKKVMIEEGRGHETSQVMIEELAKWIVRHGMKAD